MKKNFSIDPKLINYINSGIGSPALFALIFSIATDLITFEWFQAFIAQGVLHGIFAYLFFEKKIISHHITVRRFLNLFCDYCSLMICIFAFGAVSLNTRSFCIYLSCSIVLGIGGGMLLGLFTDHLEKKYLGKINEKLEKNK